MEQKTQKMSAKTDSSGFEQSRIIRQAKALSKEKRRKVLMSFVELDLHRHLKELFNAMEPDYTTEITHGPDELGKDLVIVRKDAIGTHVTGVVVKTGHIRAKTVGEVDEVKDQVQKAFSPGTEKKIRDIESQVQQAFAHPAEMKTIFRKLPVSKVLVVLAGDLSNPARKRLEGELGGNVEVKDINWLIEGFTNYYPQVFFEAGTVDFLQKRMQQLERKHWLFNKRQINLSDYFVEPQVATPDIPLNLDEKTLALITKKRKMPFSQLRSLLTHTRRIVLVGEPGVGKSAALAKLAIDMLTEASALIFRGISKEEIIQIPILVSAKELLNAGTAEELLRKHFVAPDVVGRLKVKVLMIGALDEVPLGQGKEVVEKAGRFSRQLTCCVLIASRKTDAIKTLPIGFEKYELLPFEFAQAIRVFKKLVTNKQTLSSLRDGLKRIKFQIPMLPLSLLLLVDLVEDNKEIPASVTELYDRFHDLMLGRWDKEKGLPVLFEYFIKRSFLSELAFREFFQKARLEIPQKEFTEFFDEYASRYGWDKVKLERFIKEIGRAGILDVKETVLFRHRSFLDYFTARYVFDKRAEFKGLNSFIARVYFDDTWGEVAFFYVGLAREITDALIETILGAEGEDLSTNVDKFLTGRLLQAGWNSPTKTKRHGIEKAVRFAPVIRQQFLDVAEKSKVKVPRIFADFLVLTLGDLAFGSGFLFREAKSLFDELSSQPRQDALYKMLSLLWAFHRFLTPNELREAIGKSLETLLKVPRLSAEDQVRSLLLLMIIERKDRTVTRMIRKRLDRLKRKHQRIFRELLPHRRKGFK